MSYLDSKNPPPLADRELCSPQKTVHDVMERLEIVANPSEKEGMMSGNFCNFEESVYSLTPGFRVRILRPYEK